jgi:sensor domain CHASE-containing protein
MQETFGFPTFYLLMIIGAVVAVVASLTIYRTVQQARIPTFVKKARKMKKEIKGKKSISDSLLYPSKEEILVKKLGDKWEMLGLSLQKILGTGDKKKKLPETTGEFRDLKGGGS